ncbi:hypothetical protein Pelo_10036 [Pelomyxa schiedti]|nr:hypothetical protein Pelo_10036 [Pelomyxa schiedti]
MYSYRTPVRSIPLSSSPPWLLTFTPVDFFQFRATKRLEHPSPKKPTETDNQCQARVPSAAPHNTGDEIGRVGRQHWFFTERGLGWLWPWVRVPFVWAGVVLGLLVGPSLVFVAWILAFKNRRINANCFSYRLPVVDFNRTAPLNYEAMLFDSSKPSLGFLAPVFGLNETESDSQAPVKYLAICTASSLGCAVEGSFDAYACLMRWRDNTIQSGVTPTQDNIDTAKEILSGVTAPFPIDTDPVILSWIDVDDAIKTQEITTIVIFAAVDPLYMFILIIIHPIWVRVRRSPNEAALSLQPL